jgi:short-subunit dehydrogenase
MKAADARVLLTGAGGGIGRAMARTLEEAGAAVLGTGRRAGRAPWAVADLTTPEGIEAVAEAARAFGANVVVHAAGLPAFGTLQALPPARIAAVLQANLLAPMLLTQALLPQLLALPKAQVVFVGSALGRIGLPGFSVYGASKAGLHGFAEALRRELAGGPLRVQTLGPRSTRTPFNDAAAEAYQRATGSASDPPQAVAAALLALIESEAAERYVGFPERMAVRLNGLLGAGLDGGFGRHRRHLEALASSTEPEPEGATP